MKTPSIPRRCASGLCGLLALLLTAAAPAANVTLIATNSAVKVLVPTTGALDSVWYTTAYVPDSNWISGSAGVGYDGTGGSYLPMIGTDINALIKNKNGSFYMRQTFSLATTAGISALTLRVNYDDGFAAFLNGMPVTAANAPVTPVWNSFATASHEASTFVDFNISTNKYLLQAGTNVLAIQGLNTSLASSDLLILPELIAVITQTFFHVSSTLPVSGAQLSSAPAQITVNFGAAVNTNTLNAADLQVDGIAATNFTVIDSDSVQFGLPSGLSKGSHSITLGDGVIESAGGSLLSAYTGTFSILTLPSVENLPATDVFADQAILRARMTDTGGDDSVDIRFAWGLSDGGTNATAWDTLCVSGTATTNEFFAELNGLSAGTAYYYRALGINRAGTNWATSTASFSTTPVTLPAIYRLWATDISLAGAKLNGELANTGGEAPEVHIVWGNENSGTNAAVWDHDVNLGVRGEDEFYTYISGLMANTTYYFAAYASNSAGRVWKAAEQFTTPGTDLIITEFMADNSTVLADGYGAYSDWIEIHNPASSAQTLTGWYLTDSASNLKKWKFPSATLGAGQYLIVFASGRNTNEPSGRLHTSFSLSAGGEYLALVRPDGTTVVSEYTFPAQYTDVSYGWSPDGTQVRYFATPTPGAANNSDYWDLVKDTKFSVDRGFYSNAFVTVITTATTNATIRYTLDGSWPTETHGTIYSNPVAIAKTTVLRAFAYRTGFESSAVEAQTYIFIDDVVHQPSNPPGWPATFVYQEGTVWNTVTANWGLSSSQIAKYEREFRAALTNSLTISLSTDMDMLLLATNTSLFGQPKPLVPQDHPVSVEIFNAPGGKSIQLNAAARMMGAASGYPTKTKPNLRLLFKSEFTDPTSGQIFRGPGKLEFPVFEDTKVETFNTLVLRGMIQSSLLYPGSGPAIRDAYAHRLQKQMGYTGVHYRFVHVYLNGLYFGVFQAQERPDDAYMESYFGGDRDDYDIKKTATSQIDIGTVDAWNALKARITAGFPAASSNYTVLREQYVDLERYADYMLLEMICANRDWPGKNFYLNCRRGNPAYGPPDLKWIPFTWDSDLAMQTGDAVVDYFGPFTVSARAASPLGSLWNALYDNPDWRRFFGDRVQKNLFNDGEMTAGKLSETWLATRDELAPLVAGEICKWSTATVAQWSNNVNVYTNNFWPFRHSSSLQHLRSHGLFPSNDAPVYDQHGGRVSAGYGVTLTNPNTSGTIKYTTDDTDPRDSVTALAYSGTPVTISKTTRLKACVYSGSIWSAMNEAVFQVAPSVEISEIMYNPAPGGIYDAQEYEFIELYNPGADTVDLSPVRLTQGIDFAFAGSSVTSLPPSGYVIVVRNLSAFAARYSTNGLRIAGVYSNVLDNGGEPVRLSEKYDQPLLAFAYDDAWYPTTDGGGYSLVKNDPAPGGDPGTSNYWRASPDYFGSPGAPDSDAAAVPVQITEVLTHTDWPQVDAVELYNPTNSAVNLGGWWLTDNLGTPKKFQIPTNTLIQPHSYLVIYEDDDANTNNVPPAGYFGGAFSLSSHGEEVYLSSPTLHWMHGFKFGAAANGVSFGRYVTSDGQEHFPVQQALTLGNTNTGPLIGPVVITEIMYYPPPGRPEYLELKNISAVPVKLYDELHPANIWRFSGGIDYTFPSNTVIQPGQYILLSETNEAAFRAAWNPPLTALVLGSYSGRLDNAGETLELVRPDNPDPDGTVPMIVSETVTYKNSSYWPSGADGTGAAFERITEASFSDDPANWRISNISGSPGDAPQVDADDDQLPDNWEVKYFGQTSHVLGGPEQDADGDGISNFREYMLGTDPRVANEDLIVHITQRDQNIELEFDSTPNGESGYYGLQRVYQPQYRIPSETSLWEALYGQPDIPATGGTVTLTNATPATSGWYRVRVILE